MTQLKLRSGKAYKRKGREENRVMLCYQGSSRNEPKTDERPVIRFRVDLPAFTLFLGSECQYLCTGIDMTGMRFSGFIHERAEPTWQLTIPLFCRNPQQPPWSARLGYPRLTITNLNIAYNFLPLNALKASD